MRIRIYEIAGPALVVIRFFLPDITDSAFYRNPRYHQATDTMDMLDYRFMAELAESLVTFLVRCR